MTITFVGGGGFEGVEAFIGTTPCGEVDFSESSVMEVGGPGTPAVCNESWRVVELVAVIGERRSTMFTTPLFEPGATHTIQNFGPFPIEDGPDVHFGIAVDLRGLSSAERNTLNGITAYVGDTLCGSASEFENDRLWISVSARTAPTVCHEYGAAITLVDRNGHVLVASPTVGLGPFYRLENFAPYPPGAGPAVPSPANAGDGGIPDPSRGLAPWVGLGVAVALLGLARRGAHTP